MRRATKFYRQGGLAADLQAREQARQTEVGVEFYRIASPGDLWSLS